MFPHKDLIPSIVRYIPIYEVYQLCLVDSATRKLIKPLLQWIFSGETTDTKVTVVVHSYNYLWKRIGYRYTTRIVYDKEGEVVGMHDGTPAIVRCELNVPNTHWFICYTPIGAQFLVRCICDSRITVFYAAKPMSYPDAMDTVIYAQQEQISLDVNNRLMVDVDTANELTAHMGRYSFGKLLCMVETGELYDFLSVRT